jgi:hypothetical protein
MSGVGQNNGVSRAIDIGSAGLFAGAAGYSAVLLIASPVAGAAVATAAFVGAHRALGRIADRPEFAVPGFAAEQLDFAEPEELPELLLTERAELLLTELAGGPPEEDEALLLEDRLEIPSDDSRVIRLFDPRLLPTAGELRERIERHLQSPSESAYPDATAELHQALADLRKSLR